MRSGLFGNETGTDGERPGTWEDTGYSRSDEEAHRNVLYPGSSAPGRTMAVFMNQMKLFSKNKWTFVLLFSAALIPVLAFLASDIIDMMMSQSPLSVQYVALLLSAMPLMVAFFTAVLCGTQIPREFKDRTAYMSIPLPMTRLEFFVGKYLAGFVLCLGVFLLAFGFAVAMSMARMDDCYPGVILRSVVLTVVSVFAFSATAFCIGCFMRRGSALVPVMLMFLILPAAFIIAGNQLDCLNLFLLLPPFLPDGALSIMSSPFTLSLAGMMDMFMGNGVDSAKVWVMAAIGIVWGIAFLILGAFKTIRREM